MLVVADSSPLIVLVKIGHTEVLPRLFGQVMVPPQVIAELTDPKRISLVRAFASSPPAWLFTREPTRIQAFQLLHEGEAAAISLALEIKADLVLIDEVRGRRVAKERQLAVTGTVGVLELAAKQGLLDLRAAFEAVKETDFWIAPALLDERLRLFEQQKPQGSS